MQKNTRYIVLNRESRSDRPRYCVTTPHTRWTLTVDRWPMTLTFNPRRAMVTTHTNSSSKVKREWKQTDGQTDGRTDRQTLPIALPSRLTRSVKTKSTDRNSICPFWRRVTEKKSNWASSLSELNSSSSTWPGGVALDDVIATSGLKSMSITNCWSAPRRTGRAR